MATTASDNAIAPPTRDAAASKPPVEAGMEGKPLGRATVPVAEDAVPFPLRAAEKASKPGQSART